MDSFTQTQTTLPLLINLGCGYQPLAKPWKNVDFKPAHWVDEIVDLNKPWPWEDSSVDQLFSSHVVEHLDSIIHFMTEAHRVLKPGGHIEIRCPYGDNLSAMADPTHKRPFYIETFNAFVYGYDETFTYSLQEDKKSWKFTFVPVELTLDVAPWVKRLPFYRLYVKYLVQFLNNVGTQIIVILRKAREGEVYVMKKGEE